MDEGVIPREIYYLTDGAGRQYAVGEATGSIRTEIWNESASQYLGARARGAVTQSHSYGEERLSTLRTPGLSYFRNRVYDQDTGRWTQKDPIGLAGGINLYQFNGNDPATYGDPYGLCPPAWKCQLVATFVRKYPKAAEALSSFIDQEAAGFACGSQEFYNCTVPPSGTGGALLGQLSLALGTARMPVGGLAGREGSSLSSAGQALDRGGMTRAGRALEKHGSLPGSVFPKAMGDVAAKNAQGQAALDDILSDVGTTSSNKFGGTDYFGGSRGGGARFDAKGNFIGFLEPRIRAFGSLWAASPSSRIL